MLRSLCRSRHPYLFGTVVAALTTGSTHAQVVINEVLENPPGAGTTENRWEFIELYGRPGLDLTGFLLVVIKGGVDRDRNQLPEVAPEIDESFRLDGYRLDADGFFVIYNTDQAGVSELAERFLTPNLAFDPSRPRTVDNRPWVNGASFRSLAVPSEQPSDRLDHDGSSTYVLVYARPARPGPSMAPNGQVEGFRKGVFHDVDFDGTIDPVVDTPSGPALLRPFQMADELAWSNRAGREYTLLDENEISETHGLNPDAVARIAYYASNPNRGHRTKDEVDRTGRVVGFRVLPTSVADESFIYGVLDSERFPEFLEFFDGFDIEGWPQLKAPTDPMALPVHASARDPEPDHDPFPAPPLRSPEGKLFLQDLRVTGFSLTPGRPNDHPEGWIAQQRFVVGDIDFDGVVGPSDLAIAEALVGASLFDMIDNGAGAPATYRWQGAAFQQVLALVNLSQRADEPTHVVTAADVESLRRRVMRRPDASD